MPFLSSVKGTILDILFPPFCVSCRRYDGKQDLLCADCRSRIIVHTAFFCSACGGRLPYPTERCHPAAYLLAAMGRYDDPVLAAAIHAFKYDRLQALQNPLGALLADYLTAILKNSDLDIRNFLVVPIPLHATRLRDRGFNQALFLAKKIAERFGCETEELLIRAKNNKPQVGLAGRAARETNVAGIFRPRDPQAITGKKILLVDDVFTSGATMGEAVRVLKENRARRIVALVLARA